MKYIKLKKCISIFLCFLFILSSIYPTKLKASSSFDVYYNGSVVSNGGSVHYEGSGGVTIGIKVPDATDFYVTFDGTTGSVNQISDGGGYNEYSFSAPSGAVTFNVVADGTALSARIINFYHDTVIKPDSKLSYVSVQARVQKVNYTTLDEPFVVDYDGYTNTGADLEQVENELSALGYTDPGKYTLEGELQVAVFVDGSDTPDGYYWASSKTLYENYTWGDFLAEELHQRASWGETKEIDSFPTVDVYGGTIIRYKDADTRELIDDSIITGNILLPDSSYTASLHHIDRYMDTGITYIMWYGTAESDEDYANDQTEYPCTLNQKLNIDLKLPSQKYCFVYFFYTKTIPVGTGTIITKVKNIDTNSTLYTKSEESLTYGSYTRIYSDIPSSELSGIVNPTCVGSDAGYNPSSDPNSSDKDNTTSQTVTLDSTNNKALIVFYVKGDTSTTTPTPTSTTTPPPTATPTPKLPPVAVIQSADEVMMGDDINIRSSSHDSDGEIVKHEWTAPTVKIPILDWGNATWFDYFGVATIKLKVTDNDGLTGSTSKKINILPPVPNAVITYTGKLKENYKITIDSVKSTSPKRYPIDTNKTVWKITAVSGCSDSDIKYLGTLSGMRSKDFLVKKQGQIKVELTVTNTAGYSDTSSILLDIQPNLPPVAQFFVPRQSIRENVDSQGRRYGETTVYDSSYSPDGDKIIYRKYYCRYDKDNDDNFEEEALNMFYEGTAKEATLRYYNDQAVGWCRYDIYVEEDLLEKDANGNYINTIPEFIASEDIKSASTFYLK